MNVLILGSGGREHTLAWKIAQSPLLKSLFIAPGNAGTELEGTNLDLDILDPKEVADTIAAHEIDLVVVGPEAPLVGGIRDEIESDSRLQHVGIIGPGKAGAELEGSKAFAKAFMQRHNIPTAAYREFTAATLEEGKSFLATLTPPYVLKADGLAAGKGVLILDDLTEACTELEAMLVDAKFGTASATVVIEEFLKGIELSCFVLCDGPDYKLLPFAKDYKRIGEGDTGLNTGGMGAVSPVPFMDDELRARIEERIVKPSVDGLEKDGIRYQGFLFIGLMICDGNPMVIEYNVRMGDPETEVVIPRVKNDLLEVLRAVKEGKLAEQEIEIDPRTATTVMAVSGGYPEKYDKGFPITGLENKSEVILFHSGTKSKDGQIHTNGGRVITATAMGTNLNEALEKSYRALTKLDFEGMYYRKDIGFDL